MAPSVEPTTFIRNNTRFDESPGGNTETIIDSSVTAKAMPLAIHTPGLPPGISTAWGFSRRSLRPASLIAAAYMYRNGMKYRMMATSTNPWYAPRAVSLIWLINKITPETTACTMIATYGVFQRGWILPNALGR